MKVKELIEQLKFYDSDSEVYIYNYSNNPVLMISSIDYDYADPKEINTDVIIFAY